MIRKYLRRLVDFILPQPKPTTDRPDFQNDSAEKRLRRTKFLVEATDHEQHLLWEAHCKDNRYGRKGHLTWEKVRFGCDGWIITVGHFAGFPVCIDIRWSLVDGVLVAFWWPCSKVVHHDLIDAWLRKYFDARWGGDRRAVCDAQSFYQCLQAIEEIKQARLDTFIAS